MPYSGGGGDGTRSSHILYGLKQTSKTITDDYHQWLILPTANLETNKKH